MHPPSHPTPPCIPLHPLAPPRVPLQVRGIGGAPFGTRPEQRTSYQTASQAAWSCDAVGSAACSKVVLAAADPPPEPTCFQAAAEGSGSGRADPPITHVGLAAPSRSLTAALMGSCARATAA